MDYEKKYKEALERAKEYHFDGVKQCIADTLEYIFPELAEPEDERIRKALIEYFNEQCDMSDWNGVYGYQVVAWLEKQAERKTPQWMIDFLDNYRRMIGCSLDYDEARDVDGKILCIKEWLEKRGEKPQGKTALEAINEEKVDNANKVEPKFHEGDWIVLKNKYYKVNYNGCGYELIDQNGLKTSLGYLLVDNNAHLWTTKDAKDGDVLAASDGSIFLFAGVVDLGCQYYIALELEDETIQVNDNFEHCWESVNGVTPATKEQRNLLFQKMKQAGYMWDDEKKELRKIERKSTWSAEDERNLEGIIDEIEANKNDTPDYDLATYDRFLSWLKSIKKRIGE